ncbi:synaptotagmin-4 isoform X2 [Lingula anatina]|uniref:Synaptotagmin-4 isoform X2 n=1 Tax=Lingula anatina TaxID=7574 RepID=A0A1S3H0M1_LINAN|nr:synaptotagmin-4 isoform X2 [Lingula anatina]|eukprot:XP_013378719.1 synaptotagmin-4 isoform X2 [Lingula anatina]
MGKPDRREDLGLPGWEIAVLVICVALGVGCIIFVCITCIRKLWKERKKTAKYQKMANKFSVNYKTKTHRPITHLLKRQNHVDYGYQKMPPNCDPGLGPHCHRDGLVCHGETDLRDYQYSPLILRPKASSHNGSDDGRSDRSSISHTPTKEKYHRKAYFTWSRQSSCSDPSNLLLSNGKDHTSSSQSRSASPIPRSRSRTPTPPSQAEDDLKTKSCRSMSHPSNESIETSNLLTEPKMSARSFSMVEVRQLQEKPPPGLSNKWTVHTMSYDSEPKSCTETTEALQTTLTFSIAYHSSAKSLELVVNEMIGIPSKFGFDCSSFVQINLLPKTKQKFYTESQKGTRNPPFNETFHFADITSDDLERCSLRLRVYIKEPGRSRETFLGEVFFLLSQFTWTENLQSFTQKLNKGRRKKVSTASRYMKRELGELFILLQYQAQANRLKVFVRRAQNLPGADRRSLLSPEYYVSVKLSYHSKVIEIKGTHSRHGQNPVWNEPFLFNVAEGLQPENLTLDFSVMRVHTYSKNAVVGHVRVGMNASKAGIAHWQEALMPKGLDTAKWHKIVPVIVYGTL